MILYLSILATLIYATYTDVKDRLITNGTVGFMFGLGLAHLWINQADWQMYLLSLVIGVLVWGGLFYARMFGGGDAKLMMALSFFVLPSELFLFYLCVLIAGGLQAAVWLILKKEKEMPYAVAILLGSILFSLFKFELF